MFAFFLLLAFLFFNLYFLIMNNYYLKNKYRHTSTYITTYIYIYISYLFHIYIYIHTHARNITGNLSNLNFVFLDWISFYSLYKICVIHFGT